MVTQFVFSHWQFVTVWLLDYRNIGLSPASPCPFTPAGVKGSLNSQFCFFRPDRGVGARACDAGLGAEIGVRGSRSEGMGAWRGRSSVRGAPLRVCNVSESERARASPAPLGRAEQRGGARIRAGACLSVASLRPTPGDGSSARHPAGARPWARLSFAYFSLAKQRKVRPAAGSKQAASRNPNPEIFNKN